MIYSTIGAAALGLAVAKDQVSKLIAIPDVVYLIMLVVGSLLIALGLVAFLISILHSPAMKILESIIHRNSASRYLCIYASEVDLHQLHNLYEEYFGDDVPSIDLMRQWIRQYPKAFAVVYRVDDTSIKEKKLSLVGSFKLLLITKEAVNGLEIGQLSGSTFKPDHVARRYRDAVACYVGDVVATTTFARGVLLGFLNATCAKAIQRGLPVYARPLTDEGKRVMRKNGFVQTADGVAAPEIGKICKLIMSKDQLSSDTRVSQSRKRKSRKKYA